MSKNRVKTKESSVHKALEHEHFKFNKLVVFWVLILTTYVMLIMPVLIGILAWQGITITAKLLVGVVAGVSAILGAFCKLIHSLMKPSIDKK